MEPEDRHPWLSPEASADLERRLAEGGDSLETIEGTLVSARIAGLALEREPVHGKVVVAIGTAAVALDQAEVARVIHALKCALAPYGGA